MTLAHMTFAEVERSPALRWTYPPLAWKFRQMPSTLVAREQALPAQERRSGVLAAPAALRMDRVV